MNKLNTWKKKNDFFSDNTPFKKSHSLGKDERMSKPNLSRRRFLITSGIAMAVASVLPKGFASSSQDLNSIDWEQVLRYVAQDTFAGIAAFIVPSNDEYSQRQHFILDGVGGIHNGADQFLGIALDIFVPYDKNLASPLMKAVAQMRDKVFLRYAHLSNKGYFPNGVDPETEKQFLEHVDHSFFSWLESPGPKKGLPLGIVAATLINVVAGLLYPGSIKNGFYQNFSHLRWKQKAKVFRTLEGRPELIVKVIWADPETPLGKFLVGIIKFLFGALFNFTAYASYVEPLPLLDIETLTLIARPPGWDFSQYQIDANGPRLSPADGWDVFTGYLNHEGEIENV